MSEPKKMSRYWPLFAIFTVITVAMLFIRPEWFWVPLPFMLTYLVYALDMV